MDEPKTEPGDGDDERGCDDVEPVDFPHPRRRQERVVHHDLPAATISFAGVTASARNPKQ
jgi:hypothetical protein